MKFPMINDVIRIGPDTMRPLPQSFWLAPYYKSDGASHPSHPPSSLLSRRSMKTTGAIFAFPGNRGYYILATEKRKGNGRNRGKT
jgi:hypothetical protein